MKAGRSISGLETALERTTGVRQVLALALLGDASRHAEVHEKLGKLHPRAPQVVREINRGSHGETVGSHLAALVDDTRALVSRMEAR